MLDFFISHSSKDKGRIKNLLSLLNSAHITYWYDEEKILAGYNIKECIHKGIKEAFATIAIVTKSFIKSNWTIIESQLTVSQKKRIIPIILDGNKLEANKFTTLFGNIKFLYFNDNIIDELKNVLKSIKSENDYLVSYDNLEKLKGRLYSKENITTDILCLSLKNYFEMLWDNREYAIHAARKCIVNITADITKVQMNDEPNLQDVRALLIKSNIFDDKIIQYANFIFSSAIKQDDAYFALVNKALYFIIDAYMKYKYPLNLNRDNLVMVDFDSLEFSDFEDMYEIDKMVFDDEFIASAETSYAWYKYNNYTHIAVRYTTSGKIVGYFSILPITEELYNKIMSGDFKDKDFTVDNILQYQASAFYYVYIAAVAIHPKYQNTNVFIMLYNGLTDLFISLAQQRKVYFLKVLAEASTVQGEKFCKIMKMQKVLTTKYNTTLYTLNLIPPETLIFNRRARELKKIYTDIYEEYKDTFSVND